MAIGSCARIDCENDFCDTYIPSIGNVCKECQSKITNIFTGNYTLMGLFIVVSMFIHSSKHEGGLTAEEFFKKHTKT